MLHTDEGVDTLTDKDGYIVYQFQACNFCLSCWDIRFCCCQIKKKTPIPRCNCPHNFVKNSFYVLSWNEKLDVGRYNKYRAHQLPWSSIKTINSKKKFLFDTASRLLITTAFVIIATRARASTIQQPVRLVCSVGLFTAVLISSPSSLLQKETVLQLSYGDAIKTYTLTLSSKSGSYVFTLFFCIR